MTGFAARWAQVTAKKPSIEKFFYAVSTTGVYCRAGCASRLPNPRHVRFFDSARDAEMAGYRACKRCLPKNENSRPESIVRACRRLQTESPTLAQLAAEANMSPWHFHKLFRRIAGLTPKQYAQTQLRRRLRRELKSGGAVTAAIYDAGFNSNSRVYENVYDYLGMTPTEYKNGGLGLCIRHATTKCRLGVLLAAVSDKGICMIEINRTRRAAEAELRRSFPRAQLQRADKTLAREIKEIAEFADRPGEEFPLPLDIRGTIFQQKVWRQLCNIPPGRTASYSRLAAQVGAPKSARAVANACAANKIAVAIPCHRAVGVDGALRGYRWGLDKKKKLLAAELDAKA